MLQAIREDDEAENVSVDELQLPTPLPDLINSYENEDSSLIRICILSKIKETIITQLHLRLETQLLSSTEQDEAASPEPYCHLERQIFNEDPKNMNTIFTAFFLKFLRRGAKNRSLVKAEVQLLYHVVSLAIKYFYGQEHFKFLFNEITEQIENHKDRIQCALDFFIEVIATIEFNYQESFGKDFQGFGAKINHCRFERYFTTSHLNSMLAVANFFMKRAILKDNENADDGLFCENFKIKSTEDHLCSVLQLLHRVLCFDFIGQKFSQNEDDSLTTNIIIPTKNTKYTNLCEFEKWLKNSDWIRVYQFIYLSCQMVEIKLLIIEILGDMARIHMKYFKNKNCFKVHIENVVYALADILEHSVANFSREELLKVSIGFGRNLLKLTSPAIVPIFFEINNNIYGGLLEGVKNFLIEHIITEDVFNVNIIYYFFKFIFNLHLRCKFEKNPAPYELIERITRELCRNYENYLRLLLKKLLKANSSQKKENIHIRQDYLHLRQVLESYNSEEIMIYLSPFQFMKPRYTSINSVEELFVLVCAKVTRSLYIFQTFPQNLREREFGLQMIEKSILQTIEWFAFTTYAKSSKKCSTEDERPNMPSPQGFGKKVIDHFEPTMESISQEYEEEIENEEEYCHILRNISFFILDSLGNLPERIYKHTNINSQVFILINFILKICFQADLQEDGNRGKLKALKPIIEEHLQLSVTVLERIYLKQWQYQLYLIYKETNTGNSYRYKTIENEHEFFDLAEVKHQMILIDAIQQISMPFLNNNQSAQQSLKQIEILLAYSIARQEKSLIQNYSPLNTLEDCQSLLFLLFRNQTLLNLLYIAEPVITIHFERLLQTVRQYQVKTNKISEINRYLEALSILVNIKYEETSEEMTNRLFLFLHQLTCVLEDPQQDIKIDDQFIDFLQKIDDETLKKREDLEFQGLHTKIQSIVQQFHKRKQEIG